MALITGAASGIGLGMARAFAEKGMKLALLDIDANKLEKARETFRQTGVAVRTYPLDITDRDAVCAAVEDAARELGGINVVCANAGVSGIMAPLEKLEPADWDWVIDVNVKGAVYAVQACIPHLLKHPGNAHIVITSSISGLRVYEPSRGQGMYNTSKFALVGFGEALKVDLGPHGVGVSILCPSVVKTDISHSARLRPEKYGGAIDTSGDHDLAKAAAAGTDPLQFGRWVVRGIELDRLYVITHPVDRDRVAARHEHIMEAFDASGDITK